MGGGPNFIESFKYLFKIFKSLYSVLKFKVTAMKEEKIAKYGLNSIVLELN